ncbi:zinc-binding dehydrogenase [Pseudosulfitobacter pseudonitzschiae]|uniref:zinc-binding dehydrogenase n=1 Tax=Pseudosulfitobacter pseudonitzschiae TaxID=1402135 RepID=UPI0024DF0BC4|nr:zinc-binding dehydrogenase [Pseudosulfitobacter pseudonitzschiae]UFE31185.1 zinc-binding dehydrogenase [Pseudosulfitobacter pseudonitzschiae]UFE45381.1 zinc-binding dehydrogenase [Pseudosulfitobacter pseudonitzschiae]UFE54375.1 zinc-binding dehydrogenase [Pseudosulfitobacter pseudonitzschiae]UFE68885.1 zinc-binding dehydrogenase [Pseudosulfitobacter pseudonitzschiae]UFE77838.1 zinc-binding dehydrogenase [Pseudosulfitobacter pseudonitzschiae]
MAGLEMAGEVIGMGADVKGFQLGDRVMAMAPKSYAQQCLTDYRLALRAPVMLSWEEAAATPAAMMTAHDALLTNGALSNGDCVLIEAATTSVGQAASQIARAFGAAQIIGTSGSPEKITRLTDLGITHPVNSRSEDVVAAVKSASRNHGADVIIAQIGGETANDLISAAAVKARIVNVGRLGQWSGTIDLNEHSAKRINMIGVSFRSRDLAEHSAVAAAASMDILPLIETGDFIVHVDRVFPLAEADAAQAYMKSGSHFGKIVLSV